jgi:AraC family transcriptional regulator, regulatory protein of adaptative response / DNA-3-methyladenine glycosylase II
MDFAPNAAAAAAAPASSAEASATDRGLYAAVKARDARFDGRFFIGVTSTGVYCRPVCRVRTPLFRNCRFFGNAASAEHAGFRPCLRCRPELAPGLAFVDSSRSLAQAAARLVSQAVLEGQDLRMPALAARLGVTDRHLRRIFAAEHGVTPVDFLTTQRLLHAKQLLTDTRLPVTQVALASGFASVRRFNAAFAERYRLNPSSIRRERAAADATPSAGAAGTPSVRLGYRPPYDVSGVMRFLARRALAGVEWVDEPGLTVARTIGWSHGRQRLAGWWQARFVPERHELEVEVAASLLPVMGAVLQRLRHGFDLNADPALIDPVLAAVPGPDVAGVRVPGAVCGFEAAVRVVLGQQVTVAAARTLTLRLVQAFGEPLPAAAALPPRLAAVGLARLFPSASAIARADPERIGKLGIVRQRVRALQALATEVAAGRLRLETTAPLEDTLEQLRELPGFGEWTVQLIALRALGWPDAFPATDIGVLDALVPRFGARDAKAAEAASAAWRPWRGYAVMKLWRSLENV